MLVFLCFMVFGPLRLTRGEQHVLLDTTKEQMLDWTKYPYSPNSTPGWVEESFTNFDKGINWRSYVVCDVQYPDVENWLWTPFIERGQANRIYIDIKFSIRACDLFPGRAVQCKETFSLLFYEFDAASKEPPPWDAESYKLIDRIAADEGRFKNNNEIIINTETRSVEVNKKGLYFAFMDEGACISLLAIKVYYITCPETTNNFAIFPETPTGKSESSTENIRGQCVNNADPTSAAPYSYCKSDGTWLSSLGGCECTVGHEPDLSTRQGQECRQCPIGRYKQSKGNDQCALCPPHSTAIHTGSLYCSCNPGYYRSQQDSTDEACTSPPSEPRNVSIAVIDSNSITLSWQPPRDEGGRTDITYRVACIFPTHRAAKLVYTPAQDEIHSTFVRVQGVEPNTEYKFRVYSQNGVSKIAREPPRYSEIKVTTEGIGPRRVPSLYVRNVKATSVQLVWRPPHDQFIDIEMYEVRYFERQSGGDSNDTTTLTTRNEEIDITGLREKTEYGFQVRAKTSQRWGEFSQIVYQMTGLVDPEAYPVNEGAGTPSIVGAVIAGIVLLIIVTIMVTLYFKRGSDDWVKKQVGGDTDTLEFRGPSPHYSVETLGVVHTHTNGTMPLFNTFATHKTYIDPHTYEDPHQAVRQFAKELDPRFITIEAIIGGGEFGDVCRGRLQQGERQDMLVAIKTLKPGSSEKARADFLTEASIMGQFEHPNVIFLQGVVTKGTPVMIITEYMENGSLDTFLRANDGKFQVMQLVGMMRGIAYGMQYLAEMNYVHRDLAARNVLVNSQLVCKIADFGLSREISESAIDGAYTTRGGKIPVRWTAPEAIAFRKFTSSSDAWSFGIVMWEVMSYGERPYWDWTNQEVIKQIEKGFRLPAPMDCPEALHQLMLDCWQKERSHRPTFSNIVKTLDKLICCPETLRKIATNNQVCNPFAPDAPDLTQFQSVDEWLATIKMSRYSDNFAAAGIVSIEQVARLGLTQLVDLGVTLVGHQKKIINSIQAIRTQLSVNVSEGFLV